MSTKILEKLNSNCNAVKTDPCITISRPTIFSLVGEGPALITFEGRDEFTLTIENPKYEAKNPGEYCVEISSHCAFSQVFTDIILNDAPQAGKHVVEYFTDTIPGNNCGIIPVNDEVYVTYVDVSNAGGNGNVVGLRRYDEATNTFTNVTPTLLPWADAEVPAVNTQPDALFRNYHTGTVDWFRKAWQANPVNFGDVLGYRYDPDTDIFTELGNLNIIVNDWPVHQVDAALGLPSTEDNSECSILLGSIITHDPDNVATRTEQGLYWLDPVTYKTSLALDFTTNQDAIDLGIVTVSDINVRADGQILLMTPGGGGGENVYLTDTSFSSISLLMTSGVFSNSGMLVQGNTLVFNGTNGVTERWTDEGVLIDSVALQDDGAPYDGTHSPIQPFGSAGEVITIKRITCFDCDGVVCENWYDEDNQPYSPINPRPLSKLHNLPFHELLDGTSNIYFAHGYASISIQAVTGPVIVTVDGVAITYPITGSTPIIGASWGADNEFNVDIIVDATNGKALVTGVKV